MGAVAVAGRSPQRHQRLCKRERVSSSIAYRVYIYVSSHTRTAPPCPPTHPHISPTDTPPPPLIPPLTAPPTSNITHNQSTHHPLPTHTLQAARTEACGSALYRVPALFSVLNCTQEGNHCQRTIPRDNTDRSMNVDPARTAGGPVGPQSIMRRRPRGDNSDLGCAASLERQGRGTIGPSPLA